MVDFFVIRSQREYLFKVSIFSAFFLWQTEKNFTSSSCSCYYKKWQKLDLLKGFYFLLPLSRWCVFLSLCTFFATNTQTIQPLQTKKMLCPSRKSRLLFSNEMSLLLKLEILLYVWFLRAISFRRQGNRLLFFDSSSKRIGRHSFINRARYISELIPFEWSHIKPSGF